MHNRKQKTKTGKTGKNSHAVSEVVGTILLLSLVLTTTSVFLIVGSQIISENKSSASFNAAQQAFIMAGSQLSKARFSASIYQQVPFQLSDGIVSINSSWDNSHIIVSSKSSSDTVILYNGTLGTIKCTTSQGEVAYQDGGVWVADNGGGSIMLSPPDFDYNGVTLTLPVIHVEGNDSMQASSGYKVQVDVNSSDPAVFYPLTGIYSNPVPANNLVNVSIKSDYYKAWADYISSRTSASTTIDPANKTVNVSLKTGVPMQSGMAISGFSTKAMDSGHDIPTPVEAFGLDLNTRNTGNDYTVTYGVSAPNGVTPDPDFQLTVSRTTGAGNQEHALIKSYYTYGNQKEIFETVTDFQRKDDGSIDINLLSHDIPMYYTSDSSPQSITWGDDPTRFDDSTMKEGYDDWTYQDVTYNQPKTLYDVVEHYMSLMADYDQTHGNAYGGPKYTVIGKYKFDESTSTFQLEYSSSQDIKYLYITEGTLTASLSARG